MASAAERVAEGVGFLMSDAFADLARSDPRDFTRRRKISAGGAVGALACRRGASMGLEMRHMASAGLGLAGATPAALSRARRKVSREAAASLAPRHAAAVYRDGCHMALPGGLVPVAIDGSTVPTPTNAATLAAFGSPGCNEGSRRQASMGLSCAFDPINGLVLSLETGPGSFDERSFVMGHVARAREVVGPGRRMLVLLDRGYPSLPLLADLAASGEYFVARCERNFLAAEFRDCGAAGGDLDVRVELTRSRLDGHPPEVRDRLAGTALPLRLAVVGVGGDADELLVTNAPRSLAHSREALAALYSWRWPAETCFQALKGRLQLETAWSSPDPEMLVQDVHIAAWLLNMASDLAADDTRLAVADGRALGREHEIRASLSWCVGTLRQDLPKLMRADRRRRLGLARRLVLDASRHLEPVRPGRASPRAGLRRGCGRRPSNTHKPAF